MSDKRILYTEKMVGASHPTMSDTLNRLTLVAHNNDGSHKGYVEVSQYTDLMTTASIVDADTAILVSDTQTITADFTINQPLIVASSGRINVNPTKTLTINGPFSSGLYQCFGGSGTVTFGSGTITEVYPEWWGNNITPGTTDMTTAINAAISSVSVIGGTVKLLTGTYLTTGGHTIISSRPVKIVGAGETATTIKHSGDNICFWFKSETPSSDVLTVQGMGVYDLSVTGSSTSAAATFVRLSDGWQQTVKNILSYGYTGGAVYELYNDVLWTEGTVFENVMIRDSKIGIRFLRNTENSNNTNSFNGFTAKNVSMALSQASAKFIYIPSQTARDKIVYGVNIDSCHFWFESTNGRIFDVETANQLSGRAVINVDGMGDSTNRVGYVWNYAILDLDGQLNIRQGDPTPNITIKRFLEQQTYSELPSADNLYCHAFGAPRARFKGQILELSQTVAPNTPNGVGYYSDFCPPYSNFKVTLSYRGGWYTAGVDPVSKYQAGPSIYYISVNELDRAVYITKIHGLSDPDTTIGIRPAGGGTPGAPGSQNGFVWEVYINSSNMPATLYWTMVVEML